MDYKSTLKQLYLEDIKHILEEKDKRVVFDKTNIIPDHRELYAHLKKYINYERITRKAVLGIDMYQYSSYGEFEQTLIPFLFKTMFDSTIKLCLENHRFIFQKYNAPRINRNFISTGDGGFVLFDNPLQSLLFACNFAVVLRAYNAYHYYPKLRRIIGGINMRYGITYDKVYTFNANYFGRAIINNARILQKDDLNRCLIDEHVHSWFTTNLDGVENLQIVTINEIANIFEFSKSYDAKFLEYNDEIFEKEPSRKYGIINSDILKVGVIQSKEASISVYNLHLQVTIRLYNDDDPSQTRLITVSLGNLNTTGI
ncbi:MAG: hypothetical protein JW731_15715 [Bacteroidales bacterium]|nr:hypothetical protein [Bacteroidales bacterium]